MKTEKIAKNGYYHFAIFRTIGGCTERKKPIEEIYEHETKKKHLSVLINSFKLWLFVACLSIAVTIIVLHLCNHTIK